MGRLFILGLMAVLALPGAAGAATIKVTTHADELDGSPDATCSVREAVQSANTNAAFGGCKSGGAQTDTIQLGKSHYPLTIPTTNEGANANGDLDISDGGTVLLRGKGDGVTDISTSQADRVVDIHDGTTVRFEDIQILGGDVTSFGTATGRGGDIRADEGGDLTLTRTTVSGGDAYVGGGLYLNATGLDGTLTVKRSIFITNHATGLGGALDVVGNAVSKIAKSRISENTVTDATSSADGAGVSNRATMTILDSVIEDNDAIGSPMQAAAAGGIHHTGVDLTIRRSLVRRNTASAPTNGYFEGAGGLFAGGEASESVEITNTTFHQNTAAGPDGRGAGIYAHSGTVIATNVTFADNAASDGDDIFSSAGYVLVRNSILDADDPCAGGGGIDSGQHNVASNDDPECDFVPEDVTDATDFGYKTGTPADNGGATETIALKKSSPAVDLIPKAACGVAGGEDQRRYKRPKKNCDAGAFERRAKKP